jgi:hypothetical protein
MAHAVVHCSTLATSVRDDTLCEHVMYVYKGNASSTLLHR